MFNNNFNSYGNNNNFQSTNQRFSSGNIAGINKGPSNVAGINKGPSNVAGINHGPNQIAGVKGMSSLGKANNGPARQVMSSDGRNIIKNNINNQ